MPNGLAYDQMCGQYHHLSRLVPHPSMQLALASESYVVWFTHCALAGKGSGMKAVTGRQGIGALFSGGLNVKVERKERPCLYNLCKVENWGLNEPNTNSTFYAWFREVIAHICPYFGQLLNSPLASKNHNASACSWDAGVGICMNRRLSSERKFSMEIINDL